MGIRFSTRTLSTPTWAIPRAKPPPRARPILGAILSGAGSGRRDHLRRTAVIQPPPPADQFKGPPSATPKNGLPLLFDVHVTFQVAAVCSLFSTSRAGSRPARHDRR